MRFGEPVHVYNNYFFHNTDVGVACQAERGLLVEGNYFENVEEPVEQHYAGPTGRWWRATTSSSGSPARRTARGTVQEPRTYYSYTLDDPTPSRPASRPVAGTGKI